MKQLLAAPTSASFPNARRIALGLAVIVAGTMLPTSHASAQSCDELWVERNQYYKDAGYCFHTQRGIRYFGNAGCQTDSDAGARANMGAGVRARINEIVRMEARYGCPK
jgi:hypothetical protein